jgi:hypothetical protein
MIGYWDPEVPVRSDNDSVKVTVYTNAASAILSVGNFSSKDQTCSLHIDYKKLGFDPDKYTLSIPAIDRFQSGQSLSGVPDQLRIPAKKGYLILLSQSPKNKPS